MSRRKAKACEKGINICKYLDALSNAERMVREEIERILGNDRSFHITANTEHKRLLNHLKISKHIYGRGKRHVAGRYFCSKVPLQFAEVFHIYTR